MIVLRPAASFQPGDTLVVDLAALSDEGQFTYYRDGRPAGSIAAEDLGPARAGRMLVGVDRLNLRRCRSRGCSVAGYLVRGQEVEVRDYAGSWYRMTIDGEPAGYLRAEYLRLPVALRAGLLRSFRQRTADHYKAELEPLTVEGRPIFHGFELTVADEMLSFAFFARSADRGSLTTICTAMRGVAGLVQALMAEAPPGSFPAFSAGIYLDRSGATPTADDMLAGLSGDGGVFCRPPD